MRTIIVACVALGLLLLMAPSFSLAQNAEVIKLPPPQTEGGKPLMQALKLRQSTRGGFGPEVPLSMQMLSNLLWAADGVTGLRGTIVRRPLRPTGRTSKFTSPRRPDLSCMTRSNTN